MFSEKMDSIQTDMENFDETISELENNILQLKL